MEDSQQYSWAWLTGDQLLTSGPCELVYACIVANAAATGNFIYDGTNTNGTRIVQLVSAVATIQEFKPPVPIYCRKGLYVDVGNNMQGIFVMWRDLH